jgi:hypothetical protein
VPGLAGDGGAHAGDGGAHAGDGGTLVGDGGALVGDGGARDGIPGGGGGCDRVATVVATFDDGIPSGWGVAAVGGSASTSGGELILAVTNPLGRAWVTSSCYGLRDSRVSLEVTSISAPAAARVRFGMLTATERVVAIQVSAGQLAWVVTAGNGSENVGGARAYDPVAHRYWQLRGVGDTLSVEVSGDGAAWTTLLTMPLNGTNFDQLLMDDLDAIGIEARAALGSSAPFEAHFDNLNILP